ncbi:unnamed protein product [Periconia digitata]|uniref:RapZ C-terminal domain-containing protein n=1 Tax=Periconia digitata TaxID=1303443 RepID=A0A9W4XW15_9PLEO|nr:unnamed protein product [Periconia digitata]
MGSAFFIPPSYYSEAIARSYSTWGSSQPDKEERRRENTKRPSGPRRTRSDESEHHHHHHRSHNHNRHRHPKPESANTLSTSHSAPHRPTTPNTPSSMPSVHIITYGLHYAPNPSDVKQILAKYLPPGTTHLYNIAAQTFTPPPEDMCKLYSGISPAIQDIVMRDPLARGAVMVGVEDIMTFLRARDRKDGFDVAISVCCQIGTHRSVSVAERIARGVEGCCEREARKAMVRLVHIHRHRGDKDAY